MLEVPAKILQAPAMKRQDPATILEVPAMIPMKGTNAKIIKDPGVESYAGS